ncbi:tetratricopeptide repeat protein [Peribacillus sp. SCS-155]|uniref:tetratricopeptide repeat protein n=1 Tax=Peribacillus sedimenti TaxID=3115297 RepID=UPI0039062E38
MKIGSLIKYYRTKANITQSELCEGICSVPHLSKIENNWKEANEETISLILKKLDINLQDIESKNLHINLLLQELIEHIHFYQKEKALKTFKELKHHKELIPFSDYLYLYELYKFRYYLFVRSNDQAATQKKWLNKQKINFSQHEWYLYYYYSSIYLILQKKYSQADEILVRIVHQQPDELFLGAEVYYHLALVKGQMEQPGHAVHYGRKALGLYTNQYNIKRILHTLMVLGINYTHSEIYPEALECYKHLKRNAEILGDSELMQQVFHNIGYLKRKMELLDDAIDYFKKSLEYQEQDSFHSLVSLHSLAETYYTSEDHANARVAFNKLMEASKETGNQIYRMISTFYLSLINGEETKGYDYLENKLLPVLKSSSEYRQELHTFSYLLAMHLQKTRRFEDAIKYIS